MKKCQILICIFGRNPNRPYDVHQLFGNGHQHLSGNTPSFGDKVPRTWESYGIESQKYLRIGNTELNFSGYVEPVSISHICSISDSMSRSQLSMKKRRTVTPNGRVCRVSFHTELFDSLEVTDCFVTQFTKEREEIRAGRKDHQQWWKISKKCLISIFFYSGAREAEGRPSESSLDFFI